MLMISEEEPHEEANLVEFDAKILDDVRIVEVLHNVPFELRLLLNRFPFVRRHTQILPSNSSSPVSYNHSAMLKSYQGLNGHNFTRGNVEAQIDGIVSFGC